jgi:hypothetical protein
MDAEAPVRPLPVEQRVHLRTGEDLVRIEVDGFAQ